MKSAAFPFARLNGVASRSSNHQMNHRQKGSFDLHSNPQKKTAEKTANLA
jgi:hypothetical protein